MTTTGAVGKVTALSPAQFIAYADSEGRALLREASVDLGRAVPSCPGWDLSDLVWHIGVVHHFWQDVVAGHHLDVSAYEQPDRPPADELVGWARARHGELIETLSNADPSDPAWTWCDDKTVGFIQRRIAHETALHRWDASTAIGESTRVTAALASDGVAEFVEHLLEPARPDAPWRRLRLRATDVERKWTITDGTPEPDVPRRPLDVTIRGSASDMLLWLWRREPLSSTIEIKGDDALAQELRGRGRTA